MLVTVIIWQVTMHETGAHVIRPLRVNWAHAMTATELPAI